MHRLGLMARMKAAMKPGTTPIMVGVYSQGRRLETLKTGFIGPRDDTAQ